MHLSAGQWDASSHFNAHGLRLNGNRLMNNNSGLSIDQKEDEESLAVISVPETELKLNLRPR